MVESYSLIQNRLRLGSNALVKQSGKALGHGADFTAADGAAIHLRDGGKFAQRPGAEHFVCPVNLCQRVVANFEGDVVLSSEIEYDIARDALGAGDESAGHDGVALDDKQMCGVGLGHESALVEHQRIVGSSVGCLDLR